MDDPDKPPRTAGAGAEPPSPTPSTHQQSGDEPAQQVDSLLAADSRHEEDSAESKPIEEPNSGAIPPRAVAIAATKDPSAQPDKQMVLSNLLGQFGLYQLSLTALVFVRFFCVAMMTSPGPLLAPDLTFYCNLTHGTERYLPPSANRTQKLQNACQYKLPNGTNHSCTDWVYAQGTYGITLTDSFDLVCDRDWLRSAFQSSISAGVVGAAVIWGAVSDRYGRRVSTNACFYISLGTGLLSYAAHNYLVYTISRVLCSFSDLGLVVSLATTLVETVGEKYRGTACIIAYTGWAAGVMVLPWLVEYFRDYRLLMLFTVSAHLVTWPWVMTVGESARWLLVRGRIDEAGEELRRIVRWNRCWGWCWTRQRDEDADENAGPKAQFERKFAIIRQRFDRAAERRQNRRLAKEQELAISGKRGRWRRVPLKNGLKRVMDLFRTWEIALATLTLTWLAFNSEFMYMLLVLVSSDLGDNVKLNYAIGGVMETLATFTSMVLVAKMDRRPSLVANLSVISLLCAVLAFTHETTLGIVYILNAAKWAESNLASLIYVTVTEAFPTNIRQTGNGVTGTLAYFGAVVAPFVRTELAQIFGMTTVLLAVSVIPLSAALLIYLFLKETRGCELADEAEGDDNFNEYEDQIPDKDPKAERQEPRCQICPSSP